MTLQTTSLPQQNLSAAPPCPDLYDWAWLYGGQPVYMALVTLLGAALNVFVLLVFCLHKKACTVAEVYLSNLAAADLVLVSCLPFWAVNVSNGFDWPFGRFMCKAVNLGIKINTYCTINFLVLISMDRYVALVHTLSHGRMRRTKYAKLGCVLMWGVGLLLSVPTLVFRDVKHFPEYGVTACFLEYPNLSAALFFDVMLIVFSFIVPISIISFCTVKIIQALKVQVAGRVSAASGEQKATHLMLAVLLAFLVCWLPFHAVTVLDVLSRAGLLGGCALESVLEICNQIFTYLAMFNSVLNPVVYVIVGKNFRKKVCEIFTEWNLKKSVTSESSRSSHLSSTLKTLA